MDIENINELKKYISDLEWKIACLEEENKVLNQLNQELNNHLLSVYQSWAQHPASSQSFRPCGQAYD